jgi:hypothetical protein
MKAFVAASAAAFASRSLPGPLAHEVSADATNIAVSDRTTPP